jgi:hypothetical protein
MKQFYVKLNQTDFLTRYKIVNKQEFVIFYIEDFQDAQAFDENDYIIDICKKYYPDLELLPAGQSPIEAPNTTKYAANL